MVTKDLTKYTVTTQIYVNIDKIKFIFCNKTWGWVQADFWNAGLTLSKLWIFIYHFPLQKSTVDFLFWSRNSEMKQNPASRLVYNEFTRFHLKTMDFLQKHVNRKKKNKIEIPENKFPIHVYTMNKRKFINSGNMFLFENKPCLLLHLI